MMTEKYRLTQSNADVMHQITNSGWGQLHSVVTDIKHYTAAIAYQVELVFN